MAQANSCSAITHEGFSDGVIAPKFIVVKHCEDHLHFLKVKREMCYKISPKERTLLSCYILNF